MFFCILPIFRFDVEFCKSTLATRKELIEKAPGVFAIYCVPSSKIDEEIMEVAGKKSTESKYQNFV